VDAEIAQKNGVAMQKKMRQNGRKEEKKGLGKTVYAIRWFFLAFFSCPASEKRPGCRYLTVPQCYILHTLSSL
jgi:hypothetical protein